MKIRIKQRDITDCGAACLASVGAFYKTEMSVARIRQLASTDKKGTNVLGMIEAAEKMGFEARGVRGEMSSLLKIPKPAIAHVVLKGTLHHYIVIYKVSGKFIQVMDPADGKFCKYKLEEFTEIWSGVLILIVPGDDFQIGSNVSVYTRFWHLLKPHKSIMLQALAGAGAYTLIGLSTAIYVEKIIDHVLPDNNQNLLNLLSVIMLFLLAGQTLIGVLRSIFTLKTGQSIDATLVLGYYRHLLKLPQQFFDSMRIGEIISRIGDAAKIRSFINDVAIDLAVNAFVILFAFFLMFTSHWKLALVIFLVIPLYALVYSIINKLNKRVERRVMENSAELESHLVESLSSIKTIKQFGIEDQANVKAEYQFINLLKTVYKSGLNSLSSITATTVLSRAFTIVLLWIGGAYVLDTQMTPGELMSFYALIGYFTGPAASLIGANRSFQNAIIAADRLFEIMDLERDEETSEVELTRGMLGDICLSKVSFRYGSRRNVFTNLDLTIPAGCMTAIVGESGSGKSTIISVLQKLYPIQSGAVRIGEVDLKYISKSSLRKLVGVVPQNVDLFATSVVENIAVGDYQPDMLKITHISNELGMSEFIEELPEGYASHLGENGRLLSGGQRQRLAIARALYREPEILILDEATSNLDPASEERVQEVLKKLKTAGKTVIVIAHRMSTLVNADKVVVLDNGKVIEQGDHKMLLKRNGPYWAMWKKQLSV